MLGFSLVAVAQTDKAAMTVRNADGKKLGVDIKTYGGAQITFADGKMTVKVNSKEKTVEHIFGGEITFADKAETCCSADITSLGYATFAPDQDVTIPSEVEAYAVTSINADETVTLTSIASTIPAGEGVVLKGGEGSHDFAGILFPNEADAVSGNYLVGVLQDKTVEPGSVFTLGEQAGKAGFVIEQGTTVPANTAYLEAPEGSTATFLAFDTDPSSIESINVDVEASGDTYNVLGQKVDASYKGIVITKGKKFVKR